MILIYSEWTVYSTTTHGVDSTKVNVARILVMVSICLISGCCSESNIVPVEVPKALANGRVIRLGMDIRGLRSSNEAEKAGWDGRYVRYIQGDYFTLIEYFTSCSMIDSVVLSSPARTFHRSDFMRILDVCRQSYGTESTTQTYRNHSYLWTAFAWRLSDNVRAALQCRYTEPSSPVHQEDVLSVMFFLGAYDAP